MRYFVTSIDDFSRHVSVFTIRQKSEVLSRFKEFVSSIETDFEPRRVKKLVSDNGGEYKSSEFTKFCTEKGINHITTCPYTPSQNGVAERCNRTLCNTMRSMMAQHKSPKAWWCEAIIYAAYIRNRSPSRTLDGSIPFSRRFGRSPRLNLAQEFGCRVYNMVLDGSSRKLDPMAHPARFVGVAKNEWGYLLRTKSGALITSREVSPNITETATISTPEQDCSTKDIVSETSLSKSSANDEKQAPAS